MPIYEYRCERGHTFDVMQRITDDPVTVCSTCDATVQRVFHPVAVHFKGSGFYTTDYGKKGSGASEAGDGSKKGSGDSDSSAKGDGGAKADSGSKGSKPERAASPKAGASSG